MALNFNNTEISGIVYNGTQLTEVYFNNVLVWTAGPLYELTYITADNATVTNKYSLSALPNAVANADKAGAVKIIIEGVEN